MADASGYETEHVAVSLKLAEHGLAPAVSAETVIVATGTSCDQQVLSVTERRAASAEAPAAGLAVR